MNRSLKKIPIDWNILSWLLSFWLPVAVMLAIYVGRGVYPFGDRSLLTDDFYHQYMPFLQEYRRMGIGGYSWNLGIGSNFLALFGYYLASPFHLLIFCVPEGHLLELVSYLVILKIGLCGASCHYYLEKRQGSAHPATCFFALFYALSGYMAAYYYNIMWLDVIYLAPLVLWGLEKLVKEGRAVLYCVMLALCIYTNYYLSILLCGFLLCYFLLLMLTGEHRKGAFLRFAGYSVLAAGMAGALLVPEALAMLETDFGRVTFPTKWESYFSVLDILTRHCMGIMPERGLRHWPNIYCGCGALVLIPLYVLQDRIPLRRRFASLGLCLFMLFSFSANVPSFFWHGCNYPDSLPARQSFLYILLVISMSYEAFRQLRKSDGGRVLAGSIGAAAFLLFAEKTSVQEVFMEEVFWVNLCFVLCYGALCYLYCTRGEGIRPILSGIVFVAVITESGINMAGTSIHTVDRASYLEPLRTCHALYEQGAAREETLFRMEKFTRKTKNDGALADYPSASVFSSTLNSDVMKLYQRLGMRYSKVFYCYDGATAFTGALLNVAYMLGEDDAQGNALYEPVAQEGGKYLYESKYRLPFGYVAPVGYDLPDGYREDAVALQNQMVRALGIEDDLFVEETAIYRGNEPYLRAHRGGVYYARLCTSGIKKLDFEGENTKRRFQDLKKGALLYLGELQKREEAFFTPVDEADQDKKILLSVYRLDEEVLARALNILRARHLEEVSVQGGQISGKLHLESAGRLILSVPAEKGWRVLVNGERRAFVTFGGALLALDLEAGDYEVELRYEPAGKRVGLFCSALSLLAFAGLLGSKRKALCARL